MVVRFVDDRILHIADDIEKIQVTPQQHIAYSGPKGAVHLSKEGINNGIDECINANSPGNEIRIHLDEGTNTISVFDNGRGIPFDKLINVCTTLQSSGKFGRGEGIGASAGQNGVGITAENALSETFELISYRYGERASVKFEHGKMVQDLTIKKDTSTEHGTMVKFKPSTIFLGEDCQMKAEMISEWLDDIIYLVPHKITIHFSANRTGKDGTINKKYRNKDGLYTMCKKFAEKPILDPIHLIKDMKMSEIVNARNADNTGFEQIKVQRFVGLEFAFTYDSKHTQEIAMKSFCNVVTTMDHGEHANGVKTGLINYLTKQAREALSEKDAKKIKIEPSDATNGLYLCLYLITDMNPQFGGQAKEKLNNPAFFRPLRDLTFSSLTEYFKKDPKELKKLTSYIIGNAKARLAATKEKSATVKNDLTHMDKLAITTYCAPNDKSRGAYWELHIVEGDSAFGQVKNARYDANYQGVFAVRGYGLGTFNKSWEEVMTNAEIRKLVTILGCNIGPKFSLAKCDFEKIIIMTDADADGLFIFSQLCAFFLRHLPELVLSGRIYRSISPLYTTNDTKKKYILTKLEFAQLFEERIGDNIKLVDPKTNAVLKSKELRKLLEINRLYQDTLRNISGQFSTHPEIVEFVAIHGDDLDFKKQLKRKFPEISVDDDNILSGIHTDGRYQLLNISTLYRRGIAKLREFIFKHNDGRMYYGMHQKTSKGYTDLGVMSLGNILTKCNVFRPNIVSRLKGLGELSTEELTASSMDPNNRILVQLTVEDMAAELKRFEILHGDELEERKSLLSNYDFDPEDLDN